VPSATSEFILKRIKKLRLKHGLTQEEFSERSGIAYKYYQHLEAGRKADLRLSTLERIAATYSIEVYQLLAPKEPSSRVKTKKVESRATAREPS
jgi:transcriptional regulator with XRE-family HTH domain